MNVLRESSFERAFSLHVKRLNGVCIKMHPLVHSGIPDRLILINGFAFFVEFKSENGKLSLLQEWWFDKLSAMKFKVIIINNKASLEDAKIYTNKIAGIDDKSNLQ